MNQGLVGAVVIHFGDPEPTRSCVASLVDDTSKVDRRIVVVDNSGNYDSSSPDPRVRVHHRPDNPGYGAGANAGLEEIDHDRACTVYVVFNNDTIVCDGFLGAAADAIEVGVGAAGGPIRSSAESSGYWYAGGGINFLTGTVWQRQSTDPGHCRRHVGFIPGTAMAISPVAWRDVGGFDPDFFLYNEDLDLCLRLRRLGWRLVFEPRMVCVHRLGGATGSGVGSPLYLENLTRTRLLPFDSIPHRLYLAGFHTVYNAIRAFGLMLRLRTSSQPYVVAIAKGHTQALKTVFRSGSKASIAPR